MSQMGDTNKNGDTRAPWRRRVYEVIFEADTPAGKAFDELLLVAILLSVGAVVLESVDSYRESYGTLFNIVEWVFTGLFTIEYALRLIAVRRKLRYATSFFGIVDLLAILPTYIDLFVPGAQPLMVIRGLRLIRVFRVFKLGRYVGEADVLATALRASRAKIIVFLVGVLTLVIVMGTLMTLVEGDANGFTSIPVGIYWAIVTLTTVGYGDLTPNTPVGKALASCIMIMGYGIIAVPTGIVTSELTRVRDRVTTRMCAGCSKEGHDLDAQFCKHCGDAFE